MKELDVSDEIYDRMKTQTRFTLQAIIVPSGISILLFYIVTYFYSDIFLLNGLPGVVILTASVIAVVVWTVVVVTPLLQSQLIATQLFVVALLVT